MLNFRDEGQDTPNVLKKQDGRSDVLCNGRKVLFFFLITFIIEFLVVHAGLQFLTSVQFTGNLNRVRYVPTIVRS